MLAANWPLTDKINGLCCELYALALMPLCKKKAAISPPKKDKEIIKLDLEHYVPAYINSEFGGRPGINTSINLMLSVLSILVLLIYLFMYLFINKCLIFVDYHGRVGGDFKGNWNNF